LYKAIAKTRRGSLARRVDSRTATSTASRRSHRRHRHDRVEFECGRDGAERRKEGAPAATGELLERRLAGRVERRVEARALGGVVASN
jgi:hypothetical protein